MIDFFNSEKKISGPMQFALVYFSKKLQNTEYEQPNKLLVLLVFKQVQS